MRISRTTRILLSTCICFVILAGLYFVGRPEAALVILDLLLDRGPISSQSLEAEVDKILKERQHFDQTVWAQEVSAQRHEETIVKYWDRMLRPEDDKYAVLAEIPFNTITIGAPGETLQLEWNILRTTFAGEWKTLDRKGWRRFLSEKKLSGYVIDAIEFHQSSFDEPEGENAVSVYDVLLNVTNEGRTQRWTIQSKLRIEWTDAMDEDGHFIPGVVRAFNTSVIERAGGPVFERRRLLPKNRKMASTSLSTRGSTRARERMYKRILSKVGMSVPIVYDLNRDGLPEILLPVHNTVLWNKGGGDFEERELLAASESFAYRKFRSAIAADFNRDGHVDLLCSGEYSSDADESLPEMGLYLFQGDSRGHFVKPGDRVGPATLALTNPSCITVGDIDGDDDLDIWVAQYKDPYYSGQMPTPFYDANDGYPSYLLLNLGNGRFEEVTESAGLASKQYRRTYAASFVDLDDDSDLDLLVSSDFAGADIHFNDGRGRFSDVTDTVLRERANFGMGHTFGDYNGDGALDFYVIGMSSTTMRRLNHMGLAREDFPEFEEMRTRMGYGNRMYMARGKSAFRQPEFKDSVARSGWSWGATSFDFDSDGDLDVYVANGHVSGKTTKDYCTTYWCHDVYSGTSEPNLALLKWFEDDFGGVKASMSWDGFQKNHLFMNRSGEDFLNVAFLMDTALVDDARSVISDDFNGDGRPDLLVSTRHTKGIGIGLGDYDGLELLLNRWPVSNNWVGVRLQPTAGGPSPIGAVIRIRSDSGDQIAHMVTGDSFRAQHSPMKHFGLGSSSSVDAIEVRWPGGARVIVEDPEINVYHVLDAPSER